jgi:hypothetical protein
MRLRGRPTHRSAFSESFLLLFYKKEVLLAEKSKNFHRVCLSRLSLEGQRIACLVVCFRADFSGKLWDSFPESA